MIIVQLTGGLGNQLFQYAAAKALSLHHGVPCYFDVSSFYRAELPDLEVPRNFELYAFDGVTEKIMSAKEIESVVPMKNHRKWTQRILPPYKRHIYKEPFYHFDPNFFKCRKNVYLKGGWQSEKYFTRYREQIAKALALKPGVIDRVKDKADGLRTNNTVSVHIRRGDYLRKKIIFEWHGVMSKEYYQKAFEILNKKTPGFSVQYFTDDPEWVEQELIPYMKGDIISATTNQTHFEDFYLMSQCKNNIIANSSFSWWAAWLNPNKEKIIIGPKNWFDKGPKDSYDVLPKEWLVI